MTKQLNKKGTSLVELIAVIVIMGIIAGIAVPVTIAVINRQKKNAAAKSAEAVVATIKQYVNEFLSEADTQFIVTLSFGNSATNTPTSGSYQIDSAAAVNFGENDLKEFAVENLKAKGSIKATYTLASASYSFTGSALIVNDYNITIEANGACKATTKVTGTGNGQ